MSAVELAKPTAHHGLLEGLECRHLGALGWRAVALASQAHGRQGGRHFFAQMLDGPP
jgi:hypothetical protein